MRLKVAFPLAAAVFGLAALANPASAAHCGACDYPVQCCEPEQCCMPTVRYRVCYRTVEEEQPCVCYRQVYHTVMRECRSVCYKTGLRTARLRAALHGLQAGLRGFDVVRKYTVCHTEYEQHVAQRCYTVCKPVYSEYRCPVHYCTCRPVYEQHVAQRCYTVCKPVYSEYQVPVSYCTYQAGATSSTSMQRCYTVCQPVYRNIRCRSTTAPTSRSTSSTWPSAATPSASRSTRNAKCRSTTARASRSTNSTPARSRRPAIAPCRSRAPTATRPAPASRFTRRSASRSARAATRRCQTLLPRPDRPQVLPLPGTCTFDPCTCTSHYCPGPTVNYEVQCPGHYECHSVWVPHEEVRTIRCCHYVTHEQVHTGCYTVCRMEPYTVMRATVLHDLPHGPGRPLLHGQADALHDGPGAEGGVHPVHDLPHGPGAALLHGHAAAAARWCRSRRSECIPYTTCQMVAEQHCYMVKKCRCTMVPGAERREHPVHDLPYGRGSSTATW